jgi:hypothetical protein
MLITIDREKLVELIDIGARKCYIDQLSFNGNKVQDCIMKEIDMYIAFQPDENDQIMKDLMEEKV